MKKQKWKTFRPSNGTMGEEFIVSHCDDICANFGECEILDRSFWHNLEDPEYPIEMQIKWHDDDWTEGCGKPYYETRCTAQAVALRKGSEA